MSDPLTAPKKNRWLPATRRGRFILAGCIITAFSGSLIGLHYEAEIKSAWRRWHIRLPDSVQARLANARSARVYSLYPEKTGHSCTGPLSWIEGITAKELEALPKLHGYPVLGEFTLEDDKLLASLAEELHAGTRHPEASGFMCFLPRHALSIRDDEGTLDLVICMECQRFEVHRNGSEESHHPFQMERHQRALLDLHNEVTRRSLRTALTKPLSRE